MISRTRRSWSKSASDFVSRTKYATARWQGRELSIRDGKPLYGANIDIASDQRGPIVKYRLEIKAAVARRIPHLDDQRLGRKQDVVAQKIFFPPLRSDPSYLNFDYGHSGIVGQLELPLEGRDRRPGRRLQHAKHRPHDQRAAPDPEHFFLLWIADASRQESWSANMESAASAAGPL